VIPPENEDDMQPDETDQSEAGEEASQPAVRELILLTPFRLPTQSSLYLGNEDVACFLNGHVALWHPALLALADSLPRIGSPYDYEQPTPGHIYAVPENPPLVLPDDWDDRVRDCGALAFRAPIERSGTLENLREALRPYLEGQLAGATGPDAERLQRALALLAIPAERAAPFFGIGFGHAQLEALFEAMDHENQIDAEGLLEDLRQAVTVVANEDAEARLAPLRSAAERLLAGREVVYPAPIYLLDLCLLTEENPAAGGPAEQGPGVVGGALCGRGGSAGWIGDALPGLLDRDLSLNLLSSGSRLEQLAAAHPEIMPRLRERAAGGTLEVCGGCQVEREDPLLPIESQLWNLRKGLEVTESLVGQPVQVFARGRFAFQPNTPSLLQAAGLSRALLLAFDEGVLPSHRATVVNWPATDGKQVDAFCRAPRAAHSAQTYFHVAHYLHETIMQDHAATLALLHTSPASPWYEDWMALSRLGPVLGEWFTFSRYFEEVAAGDYATPAPADEFHADYLSERTGDPESAEAQSYGYSQEDRVRVYRASDEDRAHPVSAFAAQVRMRRQIDTAWSLAALYRSLAGQGEPLPLERPLAELEDRIEAAAKPQAADLEQLFACGLAAAQTLADRLLARAEGSNPGYLLLNPCNFARRVILELDGFSSPVPVEGQVKACQLDGDVARLVVEAPALGFAWFPKGGAAKPMPSRMKLADDRCVRNEFFEAEVDPTTGGLRSIRDQRTRISRLGQQLVFNPGSVVKVKQIRTTSIGPAYGEIISEGALLDDEGKVLATFRQRFRAWLGRPVLDLRIEIFPEHKPQGYPWHAYYGARFAWRDEREILLRGVNGLGYITSHTRPESPDYLELRAGRQNAVLLTGGLPFHQRHGGRMLDIILVPEGETAQAFEMAIGLDRDHPMLTAFGMTSPVAVVPTTKGPPHVGASGWLFHLDAPNLLLTSMRPAPDGADGILARLVECGNHAGHSELRCVRNPAGVSQINARGEVLSELGYSDDTVYLDVAEGELLELRIDFTREEPPEEEYEESYEDEPEDEPEDETGEGMYD
jgi:alpha-mannosidase